MLSPSLTTVIFDIGNVCVPWDPRFLYEKLVTDPNRLDWLLTEVITLDWHTHHDRGRSFRDGVAERSAQFPEVADLIAAFDTRWPETIGPPIAGTVACIEALAAKSVPLYGLSNFSAEKFPEFEESHPFMRHFKGVVVSGAEGMVKPDPAIYRLTLDRYGLEAQKCLFIDDRLENVRAAEALGIAGYHFTGPEGLRDRLIKESLLDD